MDTFSSYQNYTRKGSLFSNILKVFDKVLMNFCVNNMHQVAKAARLLATDWNGLASISGSGRLALISFKMSTGYFLEVKSAGT